MRSPPMECPTRSSGPEACAAGPTARLGYKLDMWSIAFAKAEQCKKKGVTPVPDALFLVVDRRRKSECKLASLPIWFGGENHSVGFDLQAPNLDGFAEPSELLLLTLGKCRVIQDHNRLFVGF